jgi:hypothetical protein
MFRNDAHKSEAIRVLLSRAGLERFWQERPTQEAVVAVNGGMCLSLGETVLIQVAFDIWNPVGQRSRVGDVLTRLDLELQQALWGLLEAMTFEKDNGATIDQWIKDWSI